MKKLPCIQVRNPETDEVLHVLISPMGLVPNQPREFFESAAKFAIKKLFSQEAEDPETISFRHSYFQCLSKFSYLDPISRKEVETQGYIFKDGMLFLTGSLLVGDLGMEFEASHAEQMRAEYQTLVNMGEDEDGMVHCGLS